MLIVQATEKFSKIRLYTMKESAEESAMKENKIFSAKPKQHLSPKSWLRKSAGDTSLQLLSCVHYGMGEIFLPICQISSELFFNKYFNALG
jgi:hypothetical protein